MGKFTHQTPLKRAARNQSIEASGKNVLTDRRKSTRLNSSTKGTSSTTAASLDPSHRLVRKQQFSEEKLLLPHQRQATNQKYRTSVPFDNSNTLAKVVRISRKSYSKNAEKSPHRKRTQYRRNEIIKKIPSKRLPRKISKYPKIQKAIRRQRKNPLCPKTTLQPCYPAQKKKLDSTKPRHDRAALHAYFHTFQRVFRSDHRRLTLNAIKDGPHLLVLSNFLQKMGCETIYIGEVQYPTLTTILQQCHKVHHLKKIELDIWGVEFDEILHQFLCDALFSNAPSLRTLAIRCRLEAAALCKILNSLSPSIESLDISDNMIGDSIEIIESLIRVVRQNQLKKLKLNQCGIGSAFRKELFNQLCQLGPFMTLSSLEGVDFSSIADIPPSIHALLITKQKMGSRGSLQNAPLLNYLQNRTAMNALINKKVRIWWPPTDNQIKTDFSGRYWPARVVHVDPIDVIFVVQYDNEEIENVSFRTVQPANPFAYGGGLSEENAYSFLTEQTSRSLSGQSFAAAKKPTRRSSRLTQQQLTCVPSFASLSPSFFSFLCFSDKVITRSQRGSQRSSSIIDKERQTHTLTLQHLPSQTPIFEASTDKKFDFSTTSFHNQPEHSAVEECQLSIPPKCVGNILWEGELCEFRDPDEHQGTDPSDFVGMVESLNETEPLYRVRYIYHDEESSISVASSDIRRTVFVKWEEWRSWILSVKRSLEHTLPLPFLPSIKPRFVYIQPLKDYSNTLHARKVQLKSPADMAHLDFEDFAAFFKQERAYPHPRLKIVNGLNRLKCLSSKVLLKEFQELQTASVSLKVKAEKASVLERECQKSREELDLLKLRIIDLETELNCMLCFTRRTNCVLKPCMHFNFCTNCVRNIKNCPLCRRPISGSLELATSNSRGT